MHNNKNIKSAVEKTRGIFLTYNSEPVLTMFDACCGGIIPANIDDFDFIKAPYLARDYACTHCKRCKIYSWQAAFSPADLQNQIKHLFDQEIHNVSVTKKDAAGIVQEIEVKGKNETEAIPGQKFYSAFKEIKSFCFTIEKESEKIVLHGRGYGHHLGLCQWGAREMVRDGWPYRRILSFYYPGTKFMRLS